VRVEEAGGANTVYVNSKPEAKTFAFDYVCGETTSQEAIFRNVGAPLTDTCFQGYNSTILAYGQTGSGKTHTLFGASSASSLDEESNKQRGLVPRVLENIFARIQSSASGEGSYAIKASFFEVYNEQVFDLLHASGGGNALLVREDKQRGVFVEDVIEETMTSPEDCKRVLSTGYKNRHVASTAMNRDSSRSHAIFLLKMEVTTGGGSSEEVQKTRYASFSLVDLAGSERQKDTKAEGERLREATKINQSLSTLGSVIRGLAEQKDSGAKHIRYRDSVLTFLLRDSLGGNSKTVLIAAISPSSDSMNETMTTLAFAQRAKTIRNHVQQNVTTSGTIEALQREISALRAKLLLASGETIDSGRLSLTSARRTSFGQNSAIAVASGSPLFRASSSLSMSDEVATSTNIVRIKAIVDDQHFLLSESLNRSKAIDEARLRTEIKNRGLELRLQQAEKAALTQNMKLKMREGEIKKLRGATGGGDEEDKLKVEVDCVREEMQRELLKYRLANEELERRLRVPEPQTGLSIWSDDKECKFQHELNERIVEVEEKQSQVGRQFTMLSNGTFEDELGFSLEEAKSLQARCIDSTKRAEDAEVKNSEIRICLVKTQAKLSELQAQAQESKKEEEKKSTEAADRISELQVTIAALEREVAARSSLAESMKKSGDDLKEDFQQALQVAREDFNRAMKDNAVLLRSLRELELQLVEKSSSLEVLGSQLATSKADFEQFCIQAKAKEDSMSATNALMRDSLSLSLVEKEELSKRLASLTQLAQTVEEDLHNAEEELRRSQGEAMQASSDRDAARFERDCAREEGEGHFTQLQTMLVEKEETQATIDALEAKLEEAIVLVASSTSRNEELSSLLQASASEKNAELLESMRLHDRDTAEIEKLLASLEEGQNALLNSTNEKATLQNDLQMTRAFLLELQGSVQELTHEVKIKTQTIEGLSSLKDELLLELADLKESHANGKQAVCELELKLEQTGAELAEMNVEIIKVVKERDDSKSKFDEIRKAIQSQSSLLSTSSSSSSLEQGSEDEEVSSALDSIHAKYRLALQAAEERKQQIEAEKVEIRLELLAALENSEELTRTKSTLVSKEGELKEAIRLYSSAKEEVQQMESRLSQVEHELSTSRLLAAEVESLRGSSERLKKKAKQMESDREADRLLLQETEQELFGLKDKLTQATEQLTTLEATNNELKAENLSLCGHKNSKQKIAMTMTLKKGTLVLLEKQLGKCADKDHKYFSLLLPYTHKNTSLSTFFSIHRLH